MSNLDLAQAMEDLKEMVEAQSLEIARLRENNKEKTPAASAFGGASFEANGWAAKPGFKPFGNNQEAKNPHFDPKQRQAGESIETFDGDKSRFREYIDALEDKVNINRNCYRTERVMMNVCFSSCSGRAKKVIRHRYGSQEEPFKNLQEMIATLEAVFRDAQEATNASRDLGKMQFDVREDNITDFISDLFDLASLALVPLNTRKSTLNNALLLDFDAEGILAALVNDPTVSFEDFKTKVTFMADSKQRAIRYRVERRQAGDAKAARKKATELSPNRRPAFPSRSEIKKETRFATPPVQDNPSCVRFNPEIIDMPRDEARRRGLCYNCGLPGHVRDDCPHPKSVVKAAAIRAINARWASTPSEDEKEEEEAPTESDHDSTDGEPGKDQD